MRHVLGQGNAVVIVLNTGENFIRTAVLQTDKGYPFFLVVLETQHIRFQFLGTHQRMGGRSGGFLFLGRGGGIYQHACTRAVAVNRAALAAALPGFNIEFVHQFLADIGG